MGPGSVLQLYIKVCYLFSFIKVFLGPCQPRTGSAASWYINGLAAVSQPRCRVTALWPCTCPQVEHPGEAAAAILLC